MRGRRVLRIGGIASGALVIAFGVVVVVLSINGKNTVQDELTRQQITGTPDMTPKAIEAETAKAGINVDLPTCDVAGESIDTGSEARCFARYMEVQALVATGGYTYAQMGTYTPRPNAPKSHLEPGGGTNAVDFAQIDPETGKPEQNPRRQVWVTETALATALNVSYTATQLSLFSLVVGIALVLCGIGFLVLAIAGSPVRAREPVPPRRNP